MATFASLMKGGTNGPVIVPGKPDESKLIQLIESGEMPPKDKGTAVADDDKAGIREWIANGANFDGPDEDAKIEEYVRLPEAGMEQGGGGGGGGGGGRSGRGGGGGGGNWNPLERFDENGDKKISKEEMPERMQERFDELDKDKDGALTEEEFRAGMQGRGRGGRGGEGGSRGEGGERPGATVPSEGKNPERPPFDDQ